MFRRLINVPASGSPLFKSQSEDRAHLLWFPPMNSSRQMLIQYARFKVFMAMRIHIGVFCVVSPCSNGRIPTFWGSPYLHFTLKMDTDHHITTRRHKPLKHWP